jgi:hypothetical protein
MAPPTPEMPRTGVTILFVNTALQKTHRTVLAKMHTMDAENSLPQLDWD